MTTKPHRLEIAAQLMAGHLARHGHADDGMSIEADYCIHLANALIVANHEINLPVIVEPETPGGHG